MLLLQADHIGTIPQWIQATMAFFTLILGLNAIIQKRKIKNQSLKIAELTDIANAIKGQTKVLTDQYNIAKEVNNRNISPNFIYTKIDFNDPRAGAVIYLENIGNTATEINFGDNFEADHSRPNYNSIIPVVRKGETWEVLIDLLDIGNQDSPKINFEIEYQNINRQTIKQSIVFYEGNTSVTVSSPIPKE